MKKIAFYLLISLFWCSLAFIRKPIPSKPNIVFMLADDLGWADLGCYGNTFHETPNLDKLATEGVRFTRAYSACAVCSPTRASIMTGKHPAHLKITDWIPGVIYPQAKLTNAKIRYEIPLEEELLPEILHRNGYSTYHVGKWHLGDEDKYYPHNRGFDVNIGGHGKGQPGSYFYPYKNVTPQTDYSVRFLPEGGKEGDYLTDFLTDHTLKLLEKHAHSDKPFFLNMSYYQVHTPLQAKPDYIKKYEEKKKRLGLTKYNTTYAAMVQSLDESVGRILRKLDELGLRENTIIIFTSDNGGLVEVNGNAPLREGKGFYYEGGIRVPLLVKFPTMTQPNSIQNQPICSTDYLPTLLEISQLPAKKAIDGRSFAKILKNPNSALPKRNLYWHYPHYHTPQRPPTGAILAGNYKMIEYFETGRTELYDVANDVSETKDLSKEKPALTQKLLKDLRQWRQKVDASMPTPNPKYNPDKPFANSFTAWKGENRL